MAQQANLHVATRRITGKGAARSLRRGCQQGQAEAHVPRRAGGVERIEHPRGCFRIHASSVVLYCDLQPVGGAIFLDCQGHAGCSGFHRASEATGSVASTPNIRS